MAFFLNLLVILLGLFLIGLVLIQRGKGGGLAGAFGGVGGSSPFGSKAGDAFTRITIYVAAFWILLLMVQVRVTNSATDYLLLARIVETAGRQRFEEFVRQNQFDRLGLRNTFFADEVDRPVAE